MTSSRSHACAQCLHKSVGEWSFSPKDTHRAEAWQNAAEPHHSRANQTETLWAAETPRHGPRCSAPALYARARELLVRHSHAATNSLWLTDCYWSRTPLTLAHSFILIHRLSSCQLRARDNARAAAASDFNFSNPPDGLHCGREKWSRRTRRNLSTLKKCHNEEEIARFPVPFQKS